MEASDATDQTRLRLSNRDITGNALAALFHPKSAEMALRQVSWLGPSTAIGGAAFSRFPAQWRTRRRSKGLTVAVTTRDSHPLPYSPAAYHCSDDLWSLRIKWRHFAPLLLCALARMSLLIQTVVLAKAQRRKGRKGKILAMVGLNSQRPSGPTGPIEEKYGRNRMRMRKL